MSNKNRIAKNQEIDQLLSNASISDDNKKKTGQLVHSGELIRTKGELLTVVTSPSGEYFAIGHSKGCEIYAANGTTTFALTHKLRGVGLESVVSVRFLSESLLAVISEKSINKFSIYSIGKGKVIATMEAPNEIRDIWCADDLVAISYLRFESKGFLKKKEAVGYHMIFYEWKQNKLRKLKFSTPILNLNEANLSRSGLLSVVIGPNALKFDQYRNGDFEEALPLEHDAIIALSQLSPDGKFCATSQREKLLVFMTKRQAVVAEFIVSSTEVLLPACFSPDSRLICALVAETPIIRIFKIDDDVIHSTNGIAHVERQHGMAYSTISRSENEHIMKHSIQFRMIANEWHLQMVTQEGVYYLYRVKPGTCELVENVAAANCEDVSYRF